MTRKQRALGRFGRPLAISVLTVMTVLAWLAAARADAISTRTSDNWAGYAVTARSPLISVSGAWVQPSAACTQPFPTYSAFWAGLGGFSRSSRALEQIGTEADCTAAGRRDVYAWYELVPAPPVRLRLRVRAGDLMAARVSVNGTRVLLRLWNLTTRASFSKTVTISSPDTSSAEWIAEAPSECQTVDDCRVLPLSDFGTVHFYAAQAVTLSGDAGAIAHGAFRATRMTLAAGAPALDPGPSFASSANTEATASALSSRGSSFTVSYRPGATTPSPPPLASRDRLRHDRNLPGRRR
jgi:hypothetical protein